MQEVVSCVGPPTGRILPHRPLGFGPQIWSNPLSMVLMYWYWKSPIPRWISGLAATTALRTAMSSESVPLCVY